MRWNFNQSFPLNWTHKYNKYSVKTTRKAFWDDEIWLEACVNMAEMVLVLGCGQRLTSSCVSGANLVPASFWLVSFWLFLICCSESRRSACARILLTNWGNQRLFGLVTGAVLSHSHLFRSLLKISSKLLYIVFSAKKRTGGPGQHISWWADIPVTYLCWRSLLKLQFLLHWYNPTKVKGLSDIKWFKASSFIYPASIKVAHCFCGPETF